MALRLKDLNKRVVDAQYAVRGALAIRAEQLRDEIARNPRSHPFRQVINANIGNPQQLDQQPITFFRQVLSLVQYPDLLKAPPAMYKKDALDRASLLLKHIGSVGAYSTSNGIPIIRQSIAKFIAERDGFPADPEAIFLSGGASAAVAKIITLLSTGPDTGVLIPIPQYPLYSATITLQGATQVDYYLDESNEWQAPASDIDNQVVTSESQGIKPRILVVINPGNPTGALLTEEQIRDLLVIAHKHNLVVLADEVYQTNLFRGEFVSFKKVRQQMVREDPKYDSIQLASVHSTSKGVLGECGQRGGYLELVGFHKDFTDMVYKLASVELCPVVTGQVLTELMVNPPKPGDPSYELYSQETDKIRETLHERAHELFESFKEMEGVTCDDPQGAMYLFPTITIPPRAIEAAKAQGQEPDQMYCMDLLNETGICIIPGSGFGQKPGTFHFRTTFLAPGGKEFSDLFINFHKDFMSRYK